MYNISLITGDGIGPELSESATAILDAIHDKCGLEFSIKKLQAGGIIEKCLYQEKPKRYEYILTNKGKELSPMILELVRWGLKHVPGTAVNEAVKPYL